VINLVVSLVEGLAGFGISVGRGVERPLSNVRQLVEYDSQIARPFSIPLCALENFPLLAVRAAILVFQRGVTLQFRAGRRPLKQDPRFLEGFEGF
jgi:hypothetical protein